MVREKPAHKQHVCNLRKCLRRSFLSVLPLASLVTCFLAFQWDIESDNDTDIYQPERPAKSAQPLVTYGFYMQVYIKIAPVIVTLQNIRRFYPKGPIFILQDGGNANFSQVCKMARFRCIYEYFPPGNSPWNPHPWCARFLHATKRLGTHYVIYMEPDTSITRRHVLQPLHDAGGVFANYNPAISHETVRYIEYLASDVNPCFTLEWQYMSLSGGSYFRSEAVLDAFQQKHIERIDFQGLEEVEGSKVMSSDLAMLILLASRGWTVWPWIESAQNMDDSPSNRSQWREFHSSHLGFNPFAAFQHNHKEFYHNPVDEDVMAAIRLASGAELKIGEDPPDKISCWGCVWYAGFPQAASASPKMLPLGSKAPMPSVRHRFNRTNPAEKPTCSTSAAKLAMKLAPRAEPEYLEEAIMSVK